MSPAIRRLVFAGEAVVDLVMWVPALPERGGDMIADAAGLSAGGGFNVMAAAARQGLPVLYAGGHGRGPWGDLIRTALAAEGIGVLRPPDTRADTGFDVALVERGGERTFVTSLGAETLHEPGSWDAVPAATGDAVYISGYGLAAAGSGAVLGAWAAALPDRVLLFVDPGPLVAEIPGSVLGPVQERCDWWSCNQREGQLSTGAADPAGAARRLLTQIARARARSAATGPGHRGVIVRAGAAGCVLACGGKGHARPRAAGEPHRHHRRRRRAFRSLPGRAGCGPATGGRGPPGQRRRGPVHHPLRPRHVPHPLRTRRLPPALIPSP